MDLLAGDIFRRAAAAVPDRIAAALGADAVTFGALDAAANRTAHAVLDFGLNRGDIVVVWSATTLEQLAPFAAMAKLGVVFAPVAANLSTTEVRVIVAAARPALVLADTAHGDAARDVAATTGCRAITFSELAAAAGPAPATEPNPAVRNLAERDPHIVFFTSGSTGQPKGVVLSHRVNCLRSHPGGLAQPRGPLVCMFPLFHMAGWTMALQQWQARATIVFVHSADAATLVDAVERHRAERLYCIPAVWRRVLDYVSTPEGARHDLSSLRAADTGTSATPPELLAELTAAFPHAEVRVFYGSTEAGGVATLDHADLDRKPGSCGLPTPFADVRLDADGELCVRGPLLFDGYLHDPDATRAALHDGWYHTGDLAEVDGEGYLTIVGRTKDVIRTGGETVAPAEVEQVLATYAEIADVAVVGIADAQWGEIVCAVVVPAGTGAPPQLDELREFCTGRLAGFKHPRRLEVVAAIPRTAATGQVQRRLIVERIASA